MIVLINNGHNLRLGNNDFYFVTFYPNKMTQFNCSNSKSNIVIKSWSIEDYCKNGKQVCKI